MRTSQLPKAWENVGDQIVVGFTFASDWLIEWREFSGPITERSKAKPTQSRITCDVQLKAALKEMWLSIHNGRIDSSLALKNKKKHNCL